jgi:hypothetical protein
VCHADRAKRIIRRLFARISVYPNSCSVAATRSVQPLTFYLFRTIIGLEFAAKPGDELIKHPRGRNHAVSPSAARSRTETAMEKAERQAWTIAVSLFISLFFLWGGGYNTGPIFLAALLKAFGWSHARVGSIIGGLSLAIGVSAPVAGWLLDRIEARFVMGTGAVVAVLGLIG